MQNKEYSKNYYKHNKDKKIKQVTNYQKTHPQFARKYASKYYHSHKDIVREKLLIKRYNISNKEYNELFEKQTGCCLICDRHQNNFKIRLAVDHNHKTGKVRGLLCSKCNTTLGWAELYSIKFRKYFNGD